MNHCQGEKRGRDVCVTHIIPGKDIDIVAVPKYRIRPYMEEFLRCYIPEGVQVRLDAGQFGWLGELRKITVIFIKLSDIVFAPGKTFSMMSLHHQVRFVQSVVFRYEG